jgi:phosphoribosylcarboxyaminoimidazole (NCAIR) mutase
MQLYAQTAVERGLQVIIAGAGGAAKYHPVHGSSSNMSTIGVPIKKTSTMNGQDFLYSIVQNA